MAERTVNVNINYNVNTVELDRLANASQRAQAATDRLQESGRRFGQTSSQGTNQYRRSIESVRQEMQRTRSLIDLTNRSDTKLLNERIQKYRQLKREVDQFNRSVDGTTRTAVRANNQFSGLLNTVRAVFTAIIVRQAVDMTLEMSRLAGNVESVGRAFQVAFPNADILLRQLRESTHGTVDDFVLMQRTLQATNLGVSAQHLGTLFEFAAIRAQQTGESVDYLVDSIVRGIGRKSPLVLDNLGLSLTRLREQFNGVALQSLSVAEVTEGVAVIAGEEVQKMGGFIETAATQVAKLETSWEKLRQTVAKKFEDGGIVEFMRGYVDAFQAIIEANNRGITLEELLADRRRENTAALETQLFLERNLTGEREKDVAFLEEHIRTTQKDVLARNNLIASQNQMVEAMEEELDKIQLTSEARIIEQAELRKDIEFRKGVITELINEKLHREEWLKIYLQNLNALKEGNKEQEKELGLVQELEERIKALQEQFDSSRSHDQMIRLNRQLFIMAGQLQDLKKIGLPEFRSPEVIERVGKIIDERIKKGVQAVTREFINADEVVKRLEGSIKEVDVAVTSIRFNDFFDELSEAFEENRTEILQQGIDITADFLQANKQAELEAFQQRIENTRAFYAEQLVLAGDNENAKQQIRVNEQRQLDNLRREQARKDKEARRFSIIIDTAASIARTLAYFGFTPAAIPWIALATAKGAFQLATLNKAQPRGFKKGEIGIDGPGTSTSDSIHARLSKGESIINANATRKSFRLLEAVNAGKIDDRIIRDLQVTQTGVRPVDPRAIAEPIVKAIREQQPTDVIRIGNQLYEARKRTETYRRYVRATYMKK